MPTAKKKTSVVRKKSTVKKKTPSAAPLGLTISVVGVDGKVKGTMSLPKEVFGASLNTQLLTQAIRVYLANQRVGHAATKTRGEVEGSTRKIYRQKGTGRARHGAIRAPIFVGGGIVFGPKPRDFRLTMPEKMKKAALMSALSSQFHDNNIIIVDGLEGLEPKTKLFARAFTAIGITGKTLFLTPEKSHTLTRGIRNLPHIDVMQAGDINPYALLSHQKIVFTKDAVKYFLERFKK